MELETLKILKEKYIQASQIKVLYEYRNEAKPKNIVDKNREVGLLRKQVAVWRKKGIFLTRNDQNIGIENKYWDIMVNVKNDIPEMRFIVKTHEETIGIRNISPKNNVITYEISKVISICLKNTIIENWNRMGYVDTKWIQLIEDIYISMMRKNCLHFS